MKLIMEGLIAFFLRSALWFRYKIKVQGLENLNDTTLNRPGGVLFLPNHPTVLIDAVSLSLALWPKYRLRPLIVDYMYNLPIVNSVMRLLNALPVPDFSASSNSLKKKRNDQIIDQVSAGLREKQNFLIFPSGRCKHTAYEAIDGASAVHTVIQNTPEANVVLVRVKGLWGSSFSRALTGKSPPLFSTVFSGLKHILKNLLFFTPRREVIIEFEVVSKDFPYNGSRLELNRYLENWLNLPDGFSESKNRHPGDSLVLVSYSMWKTELPEVWKPNEKADREIAIEKIPLAIRTKVIEKISEMTSTDPLTITPSQMLTTDLGMDSLDIAELVAFLQDQFDVSGVAGEEITSVGKLMAFASKQVETEGEIEEEENDLSKWHQPTSNQKNQLAPGTTIPEVFLRNCDRMGNAAACADLRSGVLTYSQLKLKALVLAEYIKTQPGTYIGIMLPASVPASVCILACQIANKVPLMINWTVGPRHLQAVAQLTNVQTVLSSWAFLDRLQNVDLTGIEDQLIMLEDLRKEIGLKHKLKAFVLSKLPTELAIKCLKIDQIDPEKPAVLLFTSGTESQPKGVPLSHRNILANQRAALQAIDIYANDIIYGILPPFHSFGFTISALIGPLSGTKVAYSPDPTDGKRLAADFARWGITIMCGAPTFIKALLKAAQPEQLKTMRLCIAGAEKLPADLIQAMDKLNKTDALLEGYGITECSPVLTFTPVGKTRVGVGKALPGIELAIIDLQTNQPLGKNRQGLILTRGPNLFSGYLNPGLSSPFIKIDDKEWYITGDLGHLDEENNLVLSGRLKRFIKVGGEMISLASIEEAILQYALKEQKISTNEEAPTLAICAKEPPGEKPRVTLFCTFSTSVDEINKALKDAGFSNLVKVNAVMKKELIPLMGSGKINYRQLEEEMG